MTTERDFIVALACSAGGLGAVREILGGLPADFRAPVVLAQHRGDTSAELFVQLLQSQTALHVKVASSLEPMRSGVVYVCPPGRHIEIGPRRTVRCSEGPRLEFVRPNCNVLFKSLALHARSRGIGVVLSGSGRDGAMGTRDVRAAGGYVIAQDEATATFPDMPAAAVEIGRVDLVLPLGQIAFALCQLVGERTLADAAA